MKILIVEDDTLLQTGISAALATEGYACDSAYDAAQAQSYIQAGEYSAILLDLGLPDKNGLQLLKQWRKEKIMIPVLVITARDSLEDRVSGLDSGADDYLIKPFELVELLARLRALIRRHQGQGDNLIEAGEISLDLANRIVRCKEELVALTPREFAILTRLMLKKDKVVNRELLQQDIYSWQDNFGSNTLEVYIHNLRQKLGKNLIQTVRGVGYRLGVSE